MDLPPTVQQQRHAHRARPTPGRKVDLVKESFDLAILPGPLEQSQLVARKLCALEQRLVASPDYLQRCGTPRTPDEFSQHDFLLRTSASGTWRFASMSGVEIDIPLPARMLSTSHMLLREAALAGRGIACLPLNLCGDDLEQGRLVPLLESLRPTETWMYAVYGSARQVPAKLRSFIDLLVEQMGEMGGCDSPVTSPSCVSGQEGFRPVPRKVSPAERGGRGNFKCNV